MKIRNILVIASLLTLGLVSGCATTSATKTDDGSARSTFDSLLQTGEIHEEPGRSLPL